MSKYKFNFHEEPIFMEIVKKLKNHFVIDFNLEFFDVVNEGVQIYKEVEKSIVLGHYDFETNTIHVNKEYGATIALSVICHEIHHKFQLESGRLKFNDTGEVVFEDETFEGNYSESPWEIESDEKAKEYFMRLMQLMSKEELIFIKQDMAKEFV